MIKRTLLKYISSLLGHTMPRKNDRSVKTSPTDNTSKVLKSLLWEFRRDNYHEYLRSESWKAKRRKILRMANYKCRQCGERATQVHHETYARIYNEKDTDLTALCEACHSKIHV